MRNYRGGGSGFYLQSVWAPPVGGGGRFFRQVSGVVFLPTSSGVVCLPTLGEVEVPEFMSGVADIIRGGAGFRRGGVIFYTLCRGKVFSRHIFLKKEWIIFYALGRGVG